MQSVLHIAALNITTSPPSTKEKYTQLLVQAFRSHSTARLQGDWVGLIGSCSVVKGTEEFVRGDLYKYFDLDRTKDWFNLSAGKKANASDLEQLSIPEHLKPHFNVLPYVFFPAEHRLVFVSKDRKDSLTPSQAQKIVQNAIHSAAPLIFTDGEVVDVIIEQSEDSLESIFKINVLNSLTIEVVPPNAFSDAEKQLLKEMGDERLSGKTIQLKSSHPKGILPSTVTKRLSKLALSLGHVFGVGRDIAGNRVEISTEEHPHIERHEFFPKLESCRQRLELIAKGMVNRILAVKNG